MAMAMHPECIQSSSKQIFYGCSKRVHARTPASPTVLPTFLSTQHLYFYATLYSSSSSTLRMGDPLMIES